MLLRCYLITWLCQVQQPVLDWVSSRCVGGCHTESSCPRALEKLLGEVRGWDRWSCGVASVQDQAVLQGFTSAPRAVGSFCVNGTGGECRIKSWVLSSHPGSEQGTAALVSYTICHWVLFCQVESTGILWWDWGGALLTIPNTAECLLHWCFYYLASFFTFKNKYTKLIHSIHQQCPRGMSS